MRNQEPSAGSASLLVLLQIPAGRDRRLERAVVLLRLVLELDLREVERELVGRQVMRAVGAAGLIRADDEVLERHHVVVLLVFALLAAEQPLVLPQEKLSISIVFGCLLSLDSPLMPSISRR